MRMRNPTIDEIDSVTELLAEAFAADPVIEQFVPRDASRRDRRLARLFLSDARTAGLDGIDLVLDDHEVLGEGRGQLLGAAIWQPPGRTRNWAKRTFDLLGLLGAVGVSGMRRLARFEAITDGYAPEGEHWYLIDIGAAPEARGRGVGGALLEHRLALIDAQHQPAFLEATTPGSRRLYERYGFEPLALIEEGPAAGATMMLRPAA